VFSNSYLSMLSHQPRQLQSNTFSSHACVLYVHSMCNLLLKHTIEALKTVWSKLHNATRKPQKFQNTDTALTSLNTCREDLLHGGGRGEGESCSSSVHPKSKLERSWTYAQKPSAGYLFQHKLLYQILSSSGLLRGVRSFLDILTLEDKTYR
jgi:hypothetical protein